MKPEKNAHFREMRLGKIGLLVLAAGLGILVTMAFLLGVQVGRDIDAYPEKIARGIPGRIAAGIGSFFAKASPEGSGVGQESQVEELAFFDILTNKRGDAGDGLLVEEDKATPAPPAAVIMVPGAPAPTPEVEEEKAPPPPPPPAPATVAPPPVTIPAAKGVNAGKIPVPAAAPAPLAAKSVDAGKGAAAAPSPAPLAASPAMPSTPAAADSGNEKRKPAAGTFSVQVVSFHERDKARQLKDKLRGLGFRAEVDEMEIAGKGKWHRVVVNGYQSRAAAEKAANDMAGKVKGLNCMIRKN